MSERALGSNFDEEKERVVYPASWSFVLVRLKDGKGRNFPTACFRGSADDGEQ
jgi:hypothetical protein